MSYLAFALKYRPQNFDEVVGQGHIVMALKNAILRNRVHHAYLFSGPRGVGKTSLARIFAKSLNCAKGPTSNPCGTCLVCVEITKGQSLDIIEIDGASNRGIDEIRTLRENVKLSPAYGRYKIYIIDEVHQITLDGFNALLKTLEEPPPHVKFIFATTHPHKVPPTILSRCQKFQFNLVPLEEIVGKLKKIVDSEGIKIKENLLYTIGRAAGGSIRDAESLLDQLVPVLLEKEVLEDVFSFLGIVDEESLNKILRYIVDKNLSASLDFIDKTVKDGKDLSVFLLALIEHLRNLLLAKISPRNFKELAEISPQTKEAVLGISEKVSAADILKIIDLLIEAKDLSHRLNTVRIPFELALIKYIQKDSDNTPQEIKKETSPQEPIREKPPKITKQENADLEREIEEVIFEEEETEIVEKEDKPQEKEEDSACEDNALLEPLKLKWQEMISYMQKTRAAIASHLSYGQPFSSKGSRIVIAFAHQDYFHKESVESNKNIKFIEEVISRFLGKSVGVKFMLKDLPSASFQPPLVEGSPESQWASEKNELNKSKGENKDDEFINELLDTFGGKFQTGGE